MDVLPAVPSSRARDRGPSGVVARSAGRLRCINVLILCTGNICRSPAAEAMLRHRLEALGLDVRVRSAGLLDNGHPAHSNSVDVLTGRGLDISSHRSRRITAAILRSADLILAMARDHVRETVVMAPDVFPRVFTLKELVRRGEAIGPRGTQESLADWLARAHAGRASCDLMGASDADDVPDPIGMPRTAYERMYEELDEQFERLVPLVWAPQYERSVR